MKDKITVEKIKQTKASASEAVRVSNLKFAQIVAQGNDQQIIPALEKFFQAVEDFKEACNQADAKKQNLAKVPEDASINLKELRSKAKQAIHEEHYAHWLMLKEFSAAADQILMQKDYKKQQVLLKDIELLTSAVNFSQGIVIKPSKFDEQKFNQMKDDITSRVEHHEKYYSSNMTMPKVWRGLLIALGALTIAAGIAAEITILLLTACTAGPLAVSAGMGLMVVGSGLITAGWGYAAYQSHQLNKEEPLATTKLSDSIHSLHGKQSTRIKETDELREQIKLNSK